MFFIEVFVGNFYVLKVYCFNSIDNEAKTVNLVTSPFTESSWMYLIERETNVLSPVVYPTSDCGQIHVNLAAI